MSMIVAGIDLWPLIKVLGASLGLIVLVLLGTAYLTYAERRVLAAMQLRKGPNVTGPFGLLQPMADGLKLMGKETIIPTGADFALFLIAPLFTFFLALWAWAVVPLGEGLVVADLNLGVLYLLALSSLGVYGIVIAGWASNSKYAFLGAMRSAAQMISYEVSIGLVLAAVLIHAGSLNLSKIVAAQRDGWFLFSILFPLFPVFFVALIAETNRHPFDLPEGESELVGGFNTEYSSMSFALFFLGEYANMILVSAMVTIFFLGGWLPPLAAVAFVPGPVWFALKVAACLFVFIWARAALPRYRYDQLMRIGWKTLLPAALAWVVVVAAFKVWGGGAA
jgi:NADH-quinone oxidoreductase subunit H